jgi:hypothetical protein
VANDRTKTQATAEKRLNKIYDALNDFDSPHFWIGAEIEAAPNHDVPLKLLKAFLRSRLAQLDPVLWNCEVPLQEMPRWRYEHGDWRGTFFPIPTGRGVGKDLSRSLGIQVSPLSPIYPAKSVRSSILQKAKHYGNPDLPFVIAVNALGNFMSERHILDALFGEVFVSRFEGDEFRMKRKRNGVWTRPAGIYTRVSAVLVCQRLNAWNFPSAKACLYHHPAPAKPLTNALAALPHVTVQNQWLCIEPGQSIGDIFGIPSEWLGDLQ